MIQFNEEKQNKKLAELREREEEELARILADKYGLSYTDLTTVSINTDALRLIPEDKAREAGAAAFNVVGKTLSVAVLSPNSQKTQQVLDDLRGKYTLKIYMVSRRSLSHAFARYKDLSFATATKEGALDVSTQKIEEILSKDMTLEQVSLSIREVLESATGHQTSQVIEIILAGSLSLKASDIHIEPQEDSVRLRYRLDGILTDVIDLKTETYKFLLSRIKLLSNLKLNVKDNAQDGRFSINVGDTDIEIRTSIIPGGYGESVVMRVLNPDAISVGIEELGISPQLLKILERELSRPNGLILNTGPTGSGKTTTLYAFLKHIHKPAIKIITIEDPIEYHLKGIVQTQTNKDYTFASGLRSAVRQDPDVILVGEIRDGDTASIAIDASLTGHLVFSTLHTNSAAGTFPRLIDLGVDPKALAPAMNVAMAQRLVRKLCPECRKEKTFSPEDQALIEGILEGLPDPSMRPAAWDVFEAVGCEACAGSGYKGRIGVFEAILVNESVEGVISSYSSEKEIRNAARVQKIPSLREDGVLKVLRGVTSLEEIRRVIDLDEESG